MTHRQELRKGKRVAILIVPLVLLAVGIVATGFVRRRSNGPLLTHTSSATPINPAALVSSTTDDGIEAELFTILPSGFEPTELRRPEGKFILAIDNRSGLAEVKLTLTRLSNGRLQHQSRLRKGKLDLREVVDLKPGVYRLSEANNPNWEVRLTITER